MLSSFQTSALKTLDIEIAQLQQLTATLKCEAFNQACELIATCQGKVVCMGIGKSGHIARKISASFASTGTSSFYVHPTEAGHGDAGMITAQDLVIYVSNSGESVEFNSLVPYFKNNHIKLIAFTNNSNSSLAQKADVILPLQVTCEACSLNLAPTASTTNTLVLGDCLVVALLDYKKFTKQDFASSHPFGLLGRRLLITNEQLMRASSALPLVSQEQQLSECLVTMSEKNLGCVLIVSATDLQQFNQGGIPPRCLGIFTDGDLRRLIAKQQDFYSTRIEQVMISKFATVEQQVLAFHTLKLLEQKAISVIPVVNQDNRVVGIIHLQDLIKAGI